MSGGSVPARRRLLLDENVPRQLARELSGHETSTVRAEGWAGIVNGELLRRAEAAGFDVLVTADRNLEHQQTVPGRGLGVVVLRPRRLKLEYLLPLAPFILRAVAAVRPGEVLRVDPPP